METKDEELNSQVIKTKWAQNKLKTELDSHKVNIYAFIYLASCNADKLYYYRKPKLNGMIPRKNCRK